MRKTLINILALQLLLLLVTATTTSAQTTVTLNQPNTGSRHTASESITLSDGFTSANGFEAYISPLAAGCVPLVSSPSSGLNYITVSTVKVSGVTTADLSSKTICEVNQVIQYLDGLGRPLQTVQLQASPGGKDIIQPVMYDAFGREAVKYLPYADYTAGNGAYRSDALTKQAQFYNTSSGWDAAVMKTGSPYTLTLFEPSPLNRVIEQGAPGDAWQPATGGTGHTLKTEYGINAASGAHAVRLFTADPVTTTGHEYERMLSSSGNYAANELYLTISKDENWVSTDNQHGTIEEYKDKEGRVVLKRTFNYNTVTSADEILSTYYVYDDLGNLCFVLPPGASPDSGTPGSTALDNYCYQYRYDGRRRLIEKKVPGKGWETTNYDPSDHPVFTQDSLQAANSERSFTKYDALERVIQAGTESGHTSSRATLQAIIDGYYIFWETRDNGGIQGYTNVAVPNNATTTSINLVNYYDDYDFAGNSFGGPATGESATVKGLLTGTRTRILGTTTFLLTVYYYDDKGRVIRSVNDNQLGGTDVVTNSYSFTGELLTSNRNHSSTTASASIATSYEYDPQGRKKNTWESINGAAAPTLLSSLDYNEVGQLKKKRLNGTTDSIAYTYNERGWVKEMNASLFSEHLDYDATYHGATAQYNGNIAEQEYTNPAMSGQYITYAYDPLNRLTAGTGSASGMSEAISYDVMGNILTLNRNGLGASTYSYSGNQLTGISGSSISMAGSTYAYDANGNMTTDARTGKTVSYNYLNLPNTVSGGITYTYDAQGNKLKKVNTTTSTTTNYIDGIQYNGTAIDFIQTEEGIARNNSGTYSYEYNLKDHLGNTRLTFYKNPSTGAADILQQDNYLPFGMAVSITAGTNKYLYNGKELQEELGDYDYGFRWYDPVTGRWLTVDPSAEKDPGISPFVYGFNNPIRFTDPDGRWPDPTFGALGMLADMAVQKVKGMFGLRQVASGAREIASNESQKQDPGYVNNVPEGTRKVVDKYRERSGQINEAQGVLEFYGTAHTAMGAAMGGVQGTFGSMAEGAEARLVLSRTERLSLFKDDLLNASAPKNPEEAISLVNTTLNDVENMHSGANDRMYGILDNKYVTNHSDGSVTALTKGHRVEIQPNGSFTIIERRTGKTFLTKEQ